MVSSWRHPALPVGVLLVILGLGNWAVSRSKLFEYGHRIASTDNLAPAGTLMGQTMGDFTHIGWQLEDDVHGGTGGKNFFDDFGFVVPAPGAAGLLGLGMLCASRRRR